MERRRYGRIYRDTILRHHNVVAFKSKHTLGQAQTSTLNAKLRNQAALHHSRVDNHRHVVSYNIQLTAARQRDVS